MRCDRCTAADGASEYVVTKGDAQVRRSFCENCAESTAEVYPVKPVRQPVKAKPKDDAPPAATESTSTGKREEA